MADAPDEGHFVHFESHPGATTEPQAAPGEAVLDVPCRHQQAGGQTLDDHHEGPTMGFTGSQVAQHSGKSTRADRHSDLGCTGTADHDPAWNRLWARCPPQRTAITAPTARDGANGIRVLRPVEETTIITNPNTIPITNPARKAT